MVWSESNGGWVKGTVHSIDKDKINMYYIGKDGDEYEKEANLDDYNVLFKERNASEEIKNIILDFNEKKDVDDDEFLEVNKSKGEDMVKNLHSPPVLLDREKVEVEKVEKVVEKVEAEKVEKVEAEINEDNEDNEDMKSQYSNHFSNYLKKIKNNKNYEIDADDLESITFFKDAAPF